jgi:hypothetical protein
MMKKDKKKKKEMLKMKKDHPHLMNGEVLESPLEMNFISFLIN